MPGSKRFFHARSLIRPFSLPLLGLALLAAAAWLAAAVQPGRPHLADSDCASCHVAGARVKAEGAPTLLGAEELLCGRCHQNQLKMSHPSGLAVRRPLPADYPLDWKGDLTCSSCHQVHGAAPGLLRGARRGREFCQACHDDAFFARMRDRGSSMMASGHGGGIDTGNAELDPYSLQCLGCHGASGEPGSVRVGRNAILRHASGSANHPIGKRYAVSARYGGYRPEPLVARRLFLPGGRVSCVSCHQGYSKEHGKLVLANTRSSLCFECHDK